MKTLFFSLLFAVIHLIAYSQNDSAIFLHHSTGGGVYSEGNVNSWMTDYNATNSTSFFVKEYEFPNTPWPWANYPYDYWKLWIDGSCDNSDPDIECLQSLASKYELVIFKHCFPGAGIDAENGDPDVSSEVKTLGNYKEQYRALRNLMDAMPDKKFMIWTLAPLHRNATITDQAERAHQFVEWVKNDFLTEDSKSHKNIIIFDFYSLVAELNSNPADGKQYCLKYDFEGDHNGTDSHPNTAANEYVGPIFAPAVVSALRLNLDDPITNSFQPKASEGFSIVPNPGNGQFQITLPEKSNKILKLQVISLDGRISRSIVLTDEENVINIQDLQKGIYIARIIIDNEVYTKSLIIK